MNSNRTTEKRKKKVTFEGNDKESKVKDGRKEIEGMRKEMKDGIERGMYEIRKEMKKIQEGMEEYKKKDRNAEVRMRLLEERIEEIDTDIKKLKDGMERIENKIKDNCEEDSEDKTSMRSQYSKGSSRRGSSWGGSMASSISEESLSIAEVGKLKKWLIKKEREERRNNIVLKGVRMEGDERLIKGALKEWVSDFLKKNIGVDGKIEHCRLSGKVIIAKLGSEDVKREVMKNKNKLKGGNIYIENDLTWDERKIQEKISRWGKEERGKGKDIKIGLGKVRINGVWKFLTDIEKEKERNDGESEKRREERDEKGEKNFG